MSLQTFALLVLILIVLTILNAFFVAAEMAISRVRKTRIDELAEQGDYLAKKTQIYLEDPETFITGGQLGITLAMLFIGALGEKTFAEEFSHWIRDVGPSMGWSVDVVLTSQIFVYAFVFTATAFIQTVFAEILPKTLTFHRAEAAIRLCILPMHFWCIITKPLLIFMNNVVAMTFKLLKVSDPPSHHLVHSEEELKMLVSASHEEGLLEEEEEEMLHSVFEFADTVANEIMTPRRDMKVLSADKSVKDFVDLALEHGHSRIPVYEEDVDSIFGFVHIRDGMKAFVDGKQNVAVRELARPIVIVPENKSLGDLLAEFKLSRVHMAIVVDEHGGTEGMVTFEDLLEELVGDIVDEHDIEEDMIQPAEDGSLLIDARISLEDINDKLDTNFEDEQFNTLGGHVFGQLGREPSEGDEIDSDNYLMRIEEADRHRIIKLRLIKKEEDEEIEDGEGNSKEDGTDAAHTSKTAVEPESKQNSKHSGKFKTIENGKQTKDNIKPLEAS
ncbi:DUF21 domain-containing protein [bacterium]|nr:DUF21 domain-containing protein [bacterium]